MPGGLAEASEAHLQSVVKHGSSGMEDAGLCSTKSKAVSGAGPAPPAAASNIKTT